MVEGTMQISKGGKQPSDLPIYELLLFIQANREGYVFHVAIYNIICHVFLFFWQCVCKQVSIAVRIILLICSIP